MNKQDAEIMYGVAFCAGIRFMLRSKSINKIEALHTNNLAKESKDYFEAWWKFYNIVPRKDKERPLAAGEVATELSG